MALLLIGCGGGNSEERPDPREGSPATDGQAFGNGEQGGDGRSGPDEGEAPRTFTTSELAAALLTPSDLPDADWTVLDSDEGDDDGDSADDQPGCGPLDRFARQSGSSGIGNPTTEASVTYAAGLFGPWVSHEVSQFAEGEADEGIDLIKRVVRDCQTLRSTADDGTVTTFKISRLDMASLGDESVAFKMTGDAGIFSVAVAFAIVRVEDTTTNVVWFGISEDIDSELIEDLARSAADKLEALHEGTLAFPVGPSAPQGESTQEAQDDSTSDIEGIVSVSLVGLTLVPEDVGESRFSDVLFFDFEYANLSGQGIRAFTGTAVFSDIFDREIKRVRLTFDSPIAPGEVGTDTDKGLELNQFSDEDQQLKGTELANLRFEFQPEAVLYQDGTIVGEVAGALDDRADLAPMDEQLGGLVSVRLVSLELVEEDFRAGRFSDVLLFGFEYTNESDQGIRAFTGTAIFADVFRREIKRVGLTYDSPIASGEVATDTEKGIELNQFSDEDQRLKSTDFADLLFFFVPDAMILEDGTTIGTP